MSFQSRTGLLLISLIEISMSAHSYKVFEFLCCSLVLNRNKGSVILRLKIDKRNKRSLQISSPFELAPPLALESHKRPGR